MNPLPRKKSKIIIYRFPGMSIIHVSEKIISYCSHSTSHIIKNIST